MIFNYGVLLFAFVSGKIRAFGFRIEGLPRRLKYLVRNHFRGQLMQFGRVVVINS